MYSTQKEVRFLVVAILPQKLRDEDAFKDLKETKSLVESFGGEVKDFIVQHRELHDKGQYVGRGKREEIADAVQKLQIDVVVLHNIVKPGQIYEIQTYLSKVKGDIKVWDRVDLILEIFARHARSAEAKLQLELASMMHMGPRIYGMGFVMSRQGGGIGTLGVGETNTELMKRHWRAQVKKVEEKFAKHVNDHQRQLRQRDRSGFKTISIIGYTNAGKTSLFNVLTKKKNLTNNSLFVTLDSSTGKVYLPNIKKDAIISDTIGFIQNLPPSLIDAFKSTLLESLHADILLHVIDATDEDMRRKIQAVEDILYELELDHKKKIYVFNKCDKVTDAIDDTPYKRFSPQFISTKTEKGIATLIETIDKLCVDERQTSDAEYSMKKRKIIHF